jgi:hypothetical protein
MVDRLPNSFKIRGKLSIVRNVSNQLKCPIQNPWEQIGASQRRDYTFSSSVSN